MSKQTGYNPTLNAQKHTFGNSSNFKIGRLVYLQNDETNILKFQDADSMLIDMQFVHFLSNEWNYDNGYKNLPKPFVLKNEVVKATGDLLLYTYIEEATQNIAVLGSLINIKYDVFDKDLRTDTDDLSNINKKHFSRNNSKRFFSIHEDAEGNISLYLLGKDADEPGTGNVGIKIEGTVGNGNVNLMFNGKLALTRFIKDGEDDKLLDQILIDEDKIKIIDKNKNVILLNEKGTVIETKNIRIGKEETLYKIMVDLISAIENISVATPAGNSLPPVLNKPQFTKLKERLEKFMDGQ